MLWRDSPAGHVLPGRYRTGAHSQVELHLISYILLIDYGLFINHMLLSKHYLEPGRGTWIVQSFCQSVVLSPSTKFVVLYFAAEGNQYSRRDSFQDFRDEETSPVRNFLSWDCSPPTTPMMRGVKSHSLVGSHGVILPTSAPRPPWSL